jgi:hypothetical protein
MTELEKIRWAPRLRQARLWQLYQSEARGLLDEDLLAEVGFTLLERCRSIDRVTRGEVECPRCGQVFAVRRPGEWTLPEGSLPCPAGCGWSTTAGDYHASWRHRDLLATRAAPALAAYLRDYPRARTPQERMLCVDRLIHAFHWDAELDLPNRAFANNLIEGKFEDVVALLDRLSAIDPEVKQHWREAIAVMWQRRRGQL